MIRICIFPLKVLIPFATDKGPDLSAELAGFLPPGWQGTALVLESWIRKFKLTEQRSVRLLFRRRDEHWPMTVVKDLSKQVKLDHGHFLQGHLIETGIDTHTHPKIWAGVTRRFALRGLHLCSVAPKQESV